MSEKSWQLPTQCICPKCEKLHIVEMFWTGKGIPKIFCKRCRYGEATNIDDSFLFTDKSPIKESKKKNNE